MSIQAALTNDPPASYVEALSQLETYSSLEADQKRKRIERSDCREALRIAQQRRFEASNAANGYAHDKENRLRFNHAKEEAHRAQEEANALEAKVKQLDVELDALQQSIDGTRIPVPAEAVAYHQSLRGDIEAKLSAMHSRRNAILDRLNATPAPDPIAPLLIEQENLLAALALGEPVEAELQRIGAAIEQAQPIRAKAEDAERADRQALAGLDRRISETEAELRRLRDLEAGLLGHLIVQGMREIAGRYEAAAASAADLLLQLQALEAIRFRVAPRVPTGLNLEMRNLHLPAPGGQPLINYWSLMEKLNNAKQAMADNLKLAGISIE